MRKEQILALRPEIPQAEINHGISEIEQFQNNTLRPIIKFQHEIILSIFSSFVRKIHKDWGSISNEKKTVIVENVLSKNQQIKNNYTGIIGGLMSLEEFEFYQLNVSKINRRISQIIKQRIQTNLADL